MQRRRGGGAGVRAPASPGHRAEVAEALARLLAGYPGVTRGKMFGFPAFYVGGKLFACVYGDGVGLKLPEATARALEGEPGVGAFQPYGRARMRGWVAIRREPPEGYARDADLFRESIRFVGQEAGRAGGARRPRTRR